MKLPLSFYQRTDVTVVARQLLGKKLVTVTSSGLTSGVIVETEAYSYCERGCHAYNGMTKRNEVMFGAGGVAYVYLCYGVHEMFNVVTNREERADAVLIRALEPVDGIDLMQQRTGAKREKRITSGPGKLTKALGIGRGWNGTSLIAGEVWIEECRRVPPAKIMASPRIGIDYAGEDAKLLWRFSIRENEWVSK